MEQRHKQLRRGDIVFCNFGSGKGSEQKGKRPAIIIQNNIGNRFSTTVIVAAISTSKKKFSKTHVEIPIEEGGLQKESHCLLEQIRSIDKERIFSILGSVSEETMNKIEKALKISLGMNEFIVGHKSVFKVEARDGTFVIVEETAQVPVPSIYDKENLRKVKIEGYENICEVSDISSDKGIKSLSMRNLELNGVALCNIINNSKVDNGFMIDGELHKVSELEFSTYIFIQAVKVQNHLLDRVKKLTEEYDIFTDIFYEDGKGSSSFALCAIKALLLNDIPLPTNINDFILFSKVIDPDNIFRRERCD